MYEWLMVYFRYGLLILHMQAMNTTDNNKFIGTVMDGQQITNWTLIIEPNDIIDPARQKSTRFTYLLCLVTGQFLDWQ